MAYPGESKVAIWPLANITISCFNMQINLISNFKEETKQQDHMHMQYSTSFKQMD